MLKVKNLSIKIIDHNKNLEKLVVEDVSFELKPQKTLAIIGESGSGKTMTALAITRQLPENALFSKDSKIILSKTDLLELPNAKLTAVRGKQIAMIFQDPLTCLNPVMTIAEQLNEIPGITKAKAIDLLAKVKLADPKRCYNSYPHELSGGMRQRVMIAMALAFNAKILIADEPTTALDVTTQAEILKLLVELKAEYELAIVFITHNLALAKQLADDIAIMRHGKILSIATTKDFFSHPDTDYAKQLLAASPKLNVTKAKMISAADKILEVKNLKIYFPIKHGFFRKTVGYTKAVDDVSFDLYAGKTLALVGESGSGKTTTGKAILRLLDNATGQVLYKSQNLLTCKSATLSELRPDIQVVFQDPFSALNNKITVEATLFEALNCNKDSLHSVDELLELVGLNPEFKHRYPHELSGGQRQRVCIARSMATDPKIIVLDEPTSALDVSIQEQILKLLQKLQQDKNLSYIFISHDLATVSQIADYIAVMYQGKIVEHGICNEVLKKPKHEYTKQLLSSVPK